MKQLTSGFFTLFTHSYTTRAPGTLAGRDSSLENFAAILNIKDLRVVA